MTDKSGCLLSLCVLMQSLRQRTFYLKNYKEAVYGLAHKASPSPQEKSSTGHKSFSWFVQQNWHSQQWCYSLAIILCHCKQDFPYRKNHDSIHPLSDTWHFITKPCIWMGFQENFLAGRIVSYMKHHKPRANALPEFLLLYNRFRP